MQHYISDNPEGILKRYPELLLTLNNRIRKKYGNRRRRKRPYLRVKQFENALCEAMDDSRKVVLFSCPICRNVLKGPVTVECGHTFCKECLERVDCDTCGICDTEIGPARAINVLVQELVEKWRERNKHFTGLY